MMPAEFMSKEIAEFAQDLRTQQKTFAFATIVRTAGSTAAKAGAKALLSADGTILQGWLGGGCTHSAVKRAALKALKDGTPQLVLVAPEDLLSKKVLTAGDQMDGTISASNSCPSRGTVEIFIEPCLPTAQLVVLGASPVALALSTLAPQFHWSVVKSTINLTAQQRQFIVVASQGQGDFDALKAAILCEPTYLAFVGSRQKRTALSKKLVTAGIDQSQISRIRTPAGLDIGAVTPEEIALSILAQLVKERHGTLKKKND